LTKIILLFIIQVLQIFASKRRSRGFTVDWGCIDSIEVNWRVILWESIDFIEFI